MHHYKSSIIQILFIVFFSCSSKKSEIAVKSFDSEQISQLTLEQVNDLSVLYSDSLTLIKDRIVSFNVDTNSRNFTLIQSFYKDSISYFANRNEFTNTIDFYNYDSGDLEKRLALQNEEPNGITSLKGFYIHNLDSIFAFSGRDNIIHLYNFEGVLKKYYQMPYDGSYVITTHIFSDMYYDDSSIYFAYSAIYPLQQIKDTSTIVSFNLENESLERIGPKYTQFITDHNFLPTQYTRNFSKGHDNKLLIKIVAFPLTYVYDIKSRKTKAYLVKSKYHKTKIEPWDGKEDKDATYMKATYYKVSYDPYRMVYYHLFSMDTPYFNENGEKNTFDDKQMSVIITDTSFRVVGEKLLDKNTYFRNMLVSEEGLLISTANAYNKEENESEIRFQLFKLISN